MRTQEQIHIIYTNVFSYIYTFIRGFACVGYHIFIHINRPTNMYTKHIHLHTYNVIYTNVFSYIHAIIRRVTRVGCNAVLSGYSHRIPGFRVLDDVVCVCIYNMYTHIPMRIRVCLYIYTYIYTCIIIYIHVHI